MNLVSGKWKSVILVGGLWLVGTAPPVSAQYLGQVTTARTLPRNTNDIGGFLGVFDHVTTVFGQYRRGVSNSIDFGIQAGLLDHDARSVDATVILGGDVKFNVMGSARDPFDMALGTRLAFFELGDVSHFAIGGSVMLSRDYRFSQGSTLTPYGGVNISLVHTSYDLGPSTPINRIRAESVARNSDSDNDLEISGVGGTKWELSDLIDAFGELVLGGIDDDWGLVLGLNFKL